MSDKIFINNWDKKILKKLDDFFRKLASGKIVNPVAVFDADGTLWRNDLGEGLFQWLINNRKLNGVDYSKDIYREYEELVRKDPGVGYKRAVTIMKGIIEKDLRQWSNDFFQNQFKHNVFSEQKELIKNLQTAGVRVWIVSASNRWTIEEAAPYMGIDPSNVIAMKTEVIKGKITDTFIPPILYGRGKVDAIKKYIGDRVHFVSGNSMGDYEMLDFASEFSLVINPDEALLKLAEKKNWNIQKL